MAVSDKLASSQTDVMDSPNHKGTGHESLGLRRLVVVVLELVPNGEHVDFRRILDFEQRNVAGPPERDDELSQERTLACPATGEGRGPQGRDAGAQRRQRSLSKTEVAAVARKRPLEHEVEQPLEIGLSVPREPDAEGHLRFFATRARAASSFRCSPSSTASGSA